MRHNRNAAPFVLALALVFNVAVAAHARPADTSGPGRSAGAPAKRLTAKQDKARRERLARRIDEILAVPEVARSFWGIEAVSLDTGRTLYEHNADKLFTPASNTKLFTTAATLALIGPDYQFRTTVETTGLVDRYGRLNGDLVLVGRGDPNLSGRVLPYAYRSDRKLPPEWVLEQLADQLVQKGVKFVDGNIVGDDSFFAFERYGEGWAQDDVVWEWGAPVSALTVNDNVIFVSIQPGDRPGDRAFIRVTPFADLVRIDNRVLTTPAGTGPAKIVPSREPGSNLLTIWGNVPVDDPGTSYSLAINDPAEFAAQIFHNLLQQRGIVVYGGVRTRHADLASLSTFSVTSYAGGGDAATRAPAAVQPLVLASYESRPLVEDVRVVNKDSQNLHAEIMLRLLGREKGSNGTIEAGAEVLRGFLTTVGIRPEEYVLLDGSGLSRQNLVAPAATVRLLTYADRQPWGTAFRESLPVAGVDGTLAGRFRNTVCQGRVVAKTGMLGHVNALSGYATALSGERVVFSIMANNHNLGSRAAIQVIDQIVSAIVDDLPPAKSKRK